jgi:hypothetical protein
LLDRYSEKSDYLQRELEMWRISARMTLVFFVTQVAVIAIWRIVYPTELPDPFAAYEAMMPGEFATGLENPVCNFQGGSGYRSVLHCELQPQDSFFVSGVSNTHNGMFVFTTFIPNRLYIGDVIGHWGRPDDVKRLSDQSFYVRWHDHRLIGIIDPVGPLTRFSYMLPIERLIIALQPPVEP